jgi:hypothetical protein
LLKLASVEKTFERPTEKDWQKVEGELGVRFPSDYKMLVSALGSGCFGCGLNLRNPISSSEYTRLSSASLAMHREMIADVEDRLDFPLYPNQNGAVIVAGIDRQDFYFCPDRRTQRLSELVWFDLDAEQVTPLKHTFSRFVHDLYVGSIDAAWAQELRDYIWRGEREPLFKPWLGSSGKSLGQEG